MKRSLLAIAAAVLITGAIENPAHACTKSQVSAYNLAVRLMHTAVDISKTVGGEKADAAVNAVLDLVESIDESLPESCGADQ
ncbi:hypothetical protein [Mesorhizobium sp. J18]|uniref:hypothetical protein n=1 Tax=Mesorhizobium sp. J18 TaxID=935263 RepID=UPI00119E06B7|nr:hypothetical protein [Mesorhizobium sp. J18]